MKTTALRLGLVLGFLMFGSPQLRAAVTVTSPTGGNNISADKALNSTNGAAFTALGNIVITEGAASDFAAGTNQTFILTGPPGWQFNPGVGTVSFASKGNITAATIAVTASNLTVTLTVNGTNAMDTLTIGGLQVQALDGANLAAADYIRCVFDNPGTEVIAGIEIDYSTFGLLNEVAGAGKALAMQTQPGTTATAGALFSPQPAVQVVDQFGNLCDLDSTTVVTAGLASGSGTLQGTLRCTSVFGVATYTDLSINVAGTITLQFTATNLTSVTSAPIVVGPAPANHLVFATQPGSASAGVPFGIQPVLKTKDQFGSDSTVGLAASQLVTVTLSSGSGTLSGNTTLDIGTGAGNGTITFTNLEIDTAGTNKQLTATSSGLSNAVSATFSVSATLFSQLQLLVPGETAAPGTLTGKTGTPNPQAAGTPFNVTVNAVDANWNLVNTIVDTVGLASSDSSATLPANAALVSGTKTFSVTLNTVGSATLTASDLTDGTKSPSTSPAITVGGGTPAKLAIQTQPSATATAGVPFAQQPVVVVQDAAGNLVSTDNGRVITAARGTGSGTLQGTLTATTVNGVATFANLAYNVAETITLNFTATNLTSVTSANVVVGSGPFTKLQLLVPGETAAPGTSTGKTGTPSGQIAGSSFGVTVNAVDAYWNLVNTVTDTVGLGSSDTTATLPPATALVAGTTNLTVVFNTNGNFTISASDLTDGTKGASTSPAITVSPAQVTPATGGGAIAADGVATGTFTSLTGPSYSENASGNVGAGTIILNVPSGFIFDTGGTAPRVLVTRLAGSGNAGNNINGVASGTAVSMTSVTSTQLIFTVTSSSQSGVTCSLTWQNVRVRPSAGTPLAAGNLSRTGTASLTGVSPTFNFGALREVAGAASNLAIQTQPSATATAGVPFDQQPVLQVRDQFGNLRSTTNGVSDSTVVTAARGAGSGTLQGTLNATATNGVATFTNLSHNVATNITLAFSASGLTGTNSSTIAISPAAADHLVFSTQPGSTTYGLALSPQPVLKSRDPFGNDSSVGLGASQLVTLTLSAGTGALEGTTTLDIGTAAGNGTVAFSGLQVSRAGTGKQLSASVTSGLTSALSSTFALNPATVTGSITANSKVYDGTTAATIATRTLSGVLAGDNVSLSGGTATFADKNVGTAKIVTATGLSLSGLDAGNYQLSSTSASTTADITTRPLLVSATGVNKVYDATTNATVTLSDNRLSGDSLTTSYTSASFTDKNVGTAKPVAVSGISLSGTDAPNYSANTNATTAANITARSLTVSATALNKVYDGTTNATVTLSDNRVAGDSLSTSFTSAGFTDKNAGTAKTVSVSGIAVTGTDASNYTFNTAATTTATITAKALTVSGITAADKVYDGTTIATLNLGSAALTGALSGDTVSLNTASATGAFASKNAGTAKLVNVSALSLSGTDAGNYTLTQPTTTASITKAALTVTANNQTRTAGQPNPTLTATYSGFVGGETLATSGVTGSPALSATTTNVAGTYPITAALGTLAATNYSFSFVNGVLTVTPASASQLVMLTQPSSTATAGVAFAQQPAILVEDAYGNVRTSDNSTVVSAARNAGSGTLQGTLTATAVNGVASFVNLSHNVANTINLTFTSAGLTNATSANIVVSPAAFTQLQLLVPGETAAPGTSTGKGGAPSGQVAGTGFGVTVNAVDAFWNLVNSVTDTVGFSSSDPTATLPPNTALAAGTTNLTVFLNANGNFTLTATDLSDGTKSPSTSPAIAVSGAQFTPATGGGAIAADGATTGTFTSLTGPSYSENASGNVGTGTIILNAPSGFVFATSGTAPSVLVTRLSGSGNAGNNINGVASGKSVSMTSVTSTQLVFTVTSSSQSGVTCSLTWKNVRVRPSAGTPLAAGNLTRTGTASLTGVSPTSNFGTLREVAGAASSLAIQIQPSATATAGVPFAQQPVLQVRDQFGNLRSTANGVADSTVVTAARGAGSGTLQGTLNATATNGLATFTNLSHNVATNITLAFSAAGLTGTNSSTIAISPAAADHLVFTTQPGSTTYGLALSPQPVLKSRDPFGNDSSVGLGASQLVTLTLSAGTGALEGTTTLDIGTAAGNGTVAFAGLQVSMAGSAKQLSASVTSGLTGALSSTFAVNPATVTGNITASSKVYDGTTAATIATRTLSGVLPGDNVSLSGGTATFASKTAGTAKTVTATGLTLSGADAGNYQLSSTNATALADITTRPLLVSATGVNRVYDGTSAATVTLSDNRVAGDSLTTSYTSASFTDKNAGTAKPVAVSGISISGTDAPNYTANTTTSTTANITARSLTVSASAANKVYDGTTNATVTLSDNRVAGDSLSTSFTSAGFADNNAGAAKTVSVSGITISGTDAPNYSANTTATTTANITPRSLTVSATGLDKVYDGSTAAAVTLSDNRLSGDSFSTSYLSASFADKNVGTAKSVSVSGISISGTDAANYSPNTTATASANITARSLTVSATGVNKVYDGTTNATVTLSDNRVAGDSLSTSYTSAGFADKNVGTAKPISVSGIALSGTDAGNYTANTSASATANITAATLTALVSASNKVYDGTTAATIVTNSLNGVLGSDNVSLNGGTAAFADKNVGTNKTVTVSGLSLNGADAANYQLGSSTTTANITVRALTVSATGLNKVYDGTTNATVTLADNRVAGDSLTAAYTTASFANKNVGTAKPVNVSGISISGTDAPNYSANTTAATTADIAVRSLTVSATGANKVYDGSTNATVTLSDNRVAGDSLSTSYTTASFADKNVGTAKSVSVSGIAVSGADAANYQLAASSATTTATITAKALTVSGITAADKVYDGTTNATLNLGSAALTGALSGDTVTLNTASATGAFASKNAGTAKLVNVSALTLSGADAGNYSLTQPTTTASITQAALTVTADNKTRAAGQPNPTLTATYSGFVGGETLATSGVTGSPALSTTTINVAGTYPITAALGTLSASNYSFSFVNGVLTVTPAAASQLVILTQPSSTATAGVAFAQQPAILIEDAYGNVRTSDNSAVVTAARNAGSGTLQGTLTATAFNGVASFVNLSHNVANTINLTFTSPGLPGTNATSANIVVSPAAFAQLQLLVPGETAAPGTTNGKTGTPSAQVVGAGFGVTVNAVDAFWNLVNSVSDTVGLSSSDTTATLPPATALAAGTTNLTVSFNANGNFTLTASDLTDSSKSPSTSPAIAVSGAQFTPATGGGAIAADGATGTFTSLTGPIYTETKAGDVGTGTIILNTPPGFIFDTGGTPPTVSSVKISGAGNSPVQGSVTSVTATQITYTVTASSSNPSKLTWQNVRVRPTSGTLLALGNLTSSGTATVAGLPANANLGLLREVPGAASTLVIQTQPSATATAGVPFAQQPVIRLQDQFGNFCTNNSSTAVTAARTSGTGSGTLQGTTTLNSVAGLVTFTNLSHNVATTITIDFTATGATTATSTPIAISPAAMSRLVFTTQPGGATAGSAFSTQPVLSTQDQFGNNTAAGLPANLNVTVTLTSGTGPLQGTTTLDIGAAAGNGTVSFTDLRIDVAGTNDQLTASASGLTNALSSMFTVNPGPSANLVIQTQPPASATAGLAFSPAPVIRLLDAFGNPVTTDNSTVVTATRNAGTAALQGTTSVTAVNGVAAFANLSYNKAETITISFSASFASVISASVTVVPGAPNKLVIGTQPSATATAGIPFTQQPVIAVTDSQGNLVSTNGLVVAAARGAGTGTLQGSLSASTVGGIATFTNLSYNVAETITLNFTSGSLTNAVSSNIVVSAAAFARLQLLVPGETAAPGTSTGKTGTPSARTAGVAFNATVNAVDAFWNLTTNLTDTVDISSTDTIAVLPADSALTNGTSLLSVTLGTAGSQTLTATDVTDGTKTNSTSSVMTVNPGPASKLLVTQQPFSTATAGVAFATQPKVTLQDSYGNTVTSYTTAVAATETSGGNLNATTTARTVTPTNGVATFSGLFVTNAASGVTLTFTSGTLTPAVSSGITVSPASAAKLLVSQQPSATATAGSAFAQQPQVIVQDTYGNTVTSYATAITAAETSGGNLNATTNAPSAAPTNGVATFSGLFVTNAASGVTLTFSSGTLTSAVSAGITVSAASAAQLAVTQQPSATATAGTAFATQPKVTIQDAYGNTVSSYATAITAAETSGGNLNATTTAPTAVPASGVASFSGLYVTNAASGVTLSFTSGTLTPATSRGISVSAASASKLVLTQQPSATATAGVAFVQQPQVTVEDTYGNAVTSYTTAITAAETSGGNLNATTTAQRATPTNGVASFSGLYVTNAATVTLTFTSGTLPSAVSTSIAVSSASASRLVLTTQPSATATAGTPFAQQPQVTAQDAYGNSVSSYATAITAAQTSGANLNATTTAQTATPSSGVATFSGLFVTNAASGVTLTFSSGTLPSVVSAGVTVSAASASQLAITQQPSATATAGTTFATQPKVTVQDAYGNAVSSYATAVSAIETSGGNLNATTTPRTATPSSGVASFSGVYVTNAASGVTLTFTSGTLAPAISSSITVSPAAASKLAVSQPPSANATAGIAFAQQPQVTVLDAYGNTVTSYATAITAAETSGGYLNATTSAQTATPSSGVASFSGLYVTNAATVTLIFTGSGVSSATSAGINVSAAPVSKLAFTTAPATVAAGAASGTITVQRQDAFGNPNTTEATRSVTLSSTSSGTVTFNPASLSIATGASSASFTYADTLAGKPTITAASTSPTTIASATQQETVNAATPSSISFVQGPPAAVSVGQTFAVTVAPSDVFGNPVSGTSVNMTLNGGGTLSGGGAQTTATNGIATFSSLSVNQTGLAKSLTASVTSPALSVTSSTFAVLGPNTVTTIGTQSDATGATTLTQTATVAAGNTIFVTLAMDPAASAVAVTDSANNTYSKDADATNSANAGVRTLIFSAPVTNALSNGTITVRFPAPTPTQKAAAFFFISDLVSPSPADKSSTAIGTSASPSSGNTATTSLPDELLLGAIGIDDKNQGITAGGSLTNLTASFTSGNSQGVRVQPACQIVSATGQYADAGSANPNKNLDWAAAIVTYKMRAPTVTAIALVNPATNRLASVSFTVSFSENVFNVDVSDFALAVNGLSGASITGLTGSGTNYMVTVATGSGSGTLGLNLVDNDSIVDVDDTPLGGTGAGNGNFTGQVYSIDWTTTTVAGNASATYGDAALTLSATVTAAVAPYPTNGNVTFYVDGISAGTSALNASGTATLNYDPQSLGAGNHIVRADFAGDGILSASSSDPSHDGTLAISQKALILTASSRSKTYGQTVAFAGTEFTTSGLINGDTVTSVTLTSSGAAPTATVAGSPYAIVPSAAAGTGLANYTITYVNGSLAVNPLAVILTGSRTYDGTATASASILALANRVGTDNVTVASGSGTLASANVGSQTLSSSGTLALGGSAAANYTLAGATGSVTISPATLTVSADNKSKVYGAADPLLTASYSGFVNGEGQGVLSGSPALSTTATVSSAVDGNPYPITVAAGTLSAANYTFRFVDGTLTVIKAPLTVAADAASRAYGATNPVFTVSYSGFVNGEGTNVLSGAPELSTVADTNSPVGGSPYSITVTNGTLSATNYAFEFVAGQLTITQAVLTVKADDQTKEYGTTNPPLTASCLGFVNGEDTNVLSGSPDLSTAVTTDTPVGVYPITVAAGSLSAANYSFAFEDGLFTVTSSPSQTSLKSALQNTASVIAQPAMLTAIQVVPNGIKITFTGSAGYTYQVQRAETLQAGGTVWQTIGKATTDSAGRGEFTDTNPPAEQGYYRTVSQ